MLENWKTMEHESDGDTNYNWCAGYSHQKMGKETEEFVNKGTSGYYPNYSIVEIDQNTEKSPGDSRRLAVTQTPIKKNQLMVVWKTLKRIK